MQYESFRNSFGEDFSFSFGYSVIFPPANLSSSSAFILCTADYVGKEKKNYSSVFPQ